VTIEDVKARFAEGWAPDLDVGVGWHDLISVLDGALARLDPEYTVVQIKEKFGGLRYYIGTIDPSVRTEAETLIHIAEQAALHSCEECGRYAAGTEEVNGWYHTLCEEHKS
jgi:hypothetical protein